jgi:hypothetical protein
MNERRTVACTIPMTADLIADPQAASILAEMAPAVISQLATENGYQLIPGTVRETEREFFTWQDTGLVDGDGDPVRTLVPLHFNPDTPADMCQVWFLADVERTS